MVHRVWLPKTNKKQTPSRSHRIQSSGWWITLQVKLEVPQLPNLPTSSMYHYTFYKVEHQVQGASPTTAWMTLSSSPTSLFLLQIASHLHTVLFKRKQDHSYCKSSLAIKEEHAERFVPNQLMHISCAIQATQPGIEEFCAVNPWLMFHLLQVQPKNQDCSARRLAIFLSFWCNGAVPSQCAHGGSSEALRTPQHHHFS